MSIPKENTVPPASSDLSLVQKLNPMEEWMLERVASKLGIDVNQLSPVQKSQLATTLRLVEEVERGGDPRLLREVNDLTLRHLAWQTLKANDPELKQHLDEKRKHESQEVQEAEQKTHKSQFKDHHGRGIKNPKAVDEVASVGTFFKEMGVVASDASASQAPLVGVAPNRHPHKRGFGIADTKAFESREG